MELEGRGELGATAQTVTIAPWDQVTEGLVEMAASVAPVEQEGRADRVDPVAKAERSA